MKGEEEDGGRRGREGKGEGGGERDVDVFQQHTQSCVFTKMPSGQEHVLTTQQPADCQPF